MKWNSLLPEAGLVLAIAVLPSQEPQELRGRVLDAEGQPAVGARVNRQWRFADPGREPAELLPQASALDDLHGAVVVDDKGGFCFERTGTSQLFALSEDGTSGALTPVGTAEGDPLEVRLSPLIDVRCRFEIKAAGEAPKQAALWVSPSSGPFAMVAVCISESRTFRVRLPAGKYNLWYSTDSVSLYTMSQLRDEPLEVYASQEVVDLGSFELDLPLVLHPKGLVLDSEGHPARVTLATSWRVMNGWMQAINGFTSDDNGRFRASVEVYDETRPIPLLALDRERKQAAFATWTPGQDELELELRRAVRVTGKYRVSAEGPGLVQEYVPAWTNTYVMVSSEVEGLVTTHRIAECQSSQARFEFALPPGKYRLEGYGSETKELGIDLLLSAESEERDLGVLELEATVITRNRGKPAMPLHVTDARGLDDGFELADLRGKWVLIEFWGYW